MPCTNPSRIWQGNAVNEKTGKRSIIKFGTMEEPLIYGGKLIWPKDDSEIGCEENPYGITSTLVPCGQCGSCRMNYAREWANRLMLEYEMHDPDTCFFVTLTYDNENINDHCLRFAIDKNTGEALLDKPVWSLNPKDLQKFMKRLRDRLGYDDDHKIRFYACGEYGEGDRHEGKSTFRPHYHLILFNLRLPSDDLTFYKKSPLGYNYCNSRLLSDVWPYGFNIVAPVTWESCCYVSRYVLKKAIGDDIVDLYDEANLQKPFVRMSRSPGIARPWYEAHKSDKGIDRISVSSANGSKTFPPPRYLERLFALDDPELGEQRARAKRKKAVNNISHILKKQSREYREYLKDCIEVNQAKAIETLDYYRNLV